MCGRGDCAAHDALAQRALDDAALDHALLHRLALLLIAALGAGFGDMHCATADYGSAACAGAQFCQGHPNRHSASLLSPAAARCALHPFGGSLP